MTKMLTLITHSHHFFGVLSVFGSLLIQRIDHRAEGSFIFMCEVESRTATDAIRWLNRFDLGDDDGLALLPEVCPRH